jgi:GDPmannose 4,6-dehydratase
VGVQGQDGSYLKDILNSQGYEVYGLTKSYLIESENVIATSSVLNIKDVDNIYKDYKFSETYYLAAYHHASDARFLVNGIEDWEKSWNIHVKGWIHCLESMLKYCPHAKAFYAASSLVFGSPSSSPQDENTPFNPQNIYGITKCAGIHVSRYYRNKHNLFVSTGILYNHESPRRLEKYISQKIIIGLINVKKGLNDYIEVGSLNSEVDWGFAPDYAQAMKMIMDTSAPDDYVISTGKTHTVEQLARIVCNLLDLPFEKVVRENKNINIERNTVTLVGNSSKIRKITGWHPTTSFEDMLKIMVQDKISNKNHE